MTKHTYEKILVIIDQEADDGAYNLMFPSGYMKRISSQIKSSIDQNMELNEATQVISSFKGFFVSDLKNGVYHFTHSVDKYIEDILILINKTT